MSAPKLRKLLFGSFRHKIFRFFFLFALVLSLFIGLLLYNISSGILRQQMYNNMSNSLQNVTYNFEALLQSVNAISTNLSLDGAMIENLEKKPDMGSYDYLMMAQQVREKLDQACYSNNNIKSIYALSADGEYFFTSKMQRTYEKEELMAADWAARLGTANGNEWIVLPGNNPVERQPEYTLTAIKPVSNVSMTKIVGYIVANIGFADIARFFGGLHFGSTGYAVVYGSNNQLIFHPNPGLYGGQETEVLPLAQQGLPSNIVESDGVLITYQRAANSGLLYAARVPISEVVSPARPVWNATLLLLGVSLLAALVYSIIISRQLFAPVGVLVNAMKKAGAGETTVQITEQRNDEMGVLYQSFNQMVLKIDQLITELYLQQMLAKELKLTNLQIQLNPHFLYNILDAIHWTARENNMDDVCAMTFLLSNYFRKSLSEGRDFIPVREVAETAKSYIELQQLRYIDKIQYTIEVDESISEELVPKYLFQPLIENAIVHGLEKKIGPGNCMVTWKKEEDGIRFEVMDDGGGIEAERLAKIKESLSGATAAENENFALKNISMQLRLYYGENYPLEIESEQGCGTKVGFTIPWKREANSHV